MIRFETIQEKVRAYLPDADFDVLRRAYVVTAQAHRGQVRKSGEPYLVHPLEVANILADLRLDLLSVVCGLLHDVVEDTRLSHADIERLFGRTAGRIIEGLTKLGRLQFSTSEANQAENLRKVLIAMTDDLRVLLIKLADRLHNMRTLDHLHAEKRVRISRETLEVYAPLAGRIGIGRIERELQDLCLRHIEPQTYRVLAARVQSKKRWADDFIGDITHLLDERLRREGISGRIEGRTKSVYSIYRKMRRQQIELDQMYDFVALRVITDSITDCYAALGVIHATWRPVPGRFRDFIAIPRPNGYRSLHTSVLTESGTHFEVQIRTSEMHRMAEEGIAAHWGYKAGGPPRDAEIKAFAWLRQMLDWQQEVDDPHEFLDSLKMNLYPEEVHCFTPKGELKTLPRDATPVDFAYAIHTDVGHRCVGARINGAMTPLNYRLRNGDICEIITRDGHQPSAKWLPFARTNRAKSRIRSRLNAIARRESVALGRKLLEREARARGVSVRRALSAEELAPEMKRRSVSGPDALFAAIGYGHVDAAGVLSACFGEAKAPDVRSRVAGAARRVIGLKAGQIEVSGEHDSLIRRAECCAPLPGEAILGYLTRGEGLAIHAATCRWLAERAMDPERRVEVSWKSVSGAVHAASYAVLLENRKGILADIARAIADTDTDIRKVEAVTDEANQGTIRVTVSVENIREARRIARTIQDVPGVIDVMRRGWERPADPDRVAAPSGNGPVPSDLSAPDDPPPSRSGTPGEPSSSPRPESDARPIAPSDPVPPVTQISTAKPVSATESVSPVRPASSQRSEPQA